MTNSKPGSTNPEPSTKPRAARWLLLSFVVWCATSVCCAAVVVAQFWSDSLELCSGAQLAAHYVAFMAATFSFHATLAAIVAFGFALLARRRRLAMVSGMCAMVGLGPSLWAALSAASKSRHDHELVIMSFNLMYGQSSSEDVVSQVKRERPDVIFFQEWTPSAAKELGPRLSGDYPFKIEIVREDAFGQSVFSRRIFAAVPRPYPASGGFREPQITVEVEHEGRVLRATNVHLLPPVGLAYFAEQRRGARALADWCGDSSRADRPHVLMGDFNSTGSSGVVGAITSQGFREAHLVAGSGRGATWPRTGFLRFVPGLRLDNAIVGPEVEVLRAEVGDDFGSDHRPILICVRWR